MNENRSGKQLLNRINQVSFAVDDLLLYLDTHPCDERALMLCRKMVKERKELLEKYDISYIFIGSCEREKYGSDLNSNLLKSLGETVFQDPDYDTCIIRVQNPSST